jgi:hypothetical protein
MFLALCFVTNLLLQPHRLNFSLMQFCNYQVEGSCVEWNTTTEYDGITSFYPALNEDPILVTSDLKEDAIYQVCLIAFKSLLAFVSEIFRSNMPTKDTFCGQDNIGFNNPPTEHLQHSTPEFYTTHPLASICNGLTFPQPFHLIQCENTFF